MSTSRSTATGPPSEVSINIPQWTIHWYDATDTKVAETTADLTFTYVGPLPHEMVGLAYDSNLEQALVGTATPVCETSNTCSYYNGTVIGRTRVRMR
ncbi:hypothetical protein AB0A74_05410 [Saccharothrix sp. NPDC042600]|uniref:hypothetical protein n=1 Tax=Saccharothrix TaxID=2071 RepID=UPI0033FAF2DB|nr:hypothetical protein GCM10017745_37390 [Saccharothrix mutabilis subsp. capreolus]